MAKLTINKGTTSKIVHIFILDSSASNGAGLIDVYANPSVSLLEANYVREGGVLTSLTLEDITILGTWASSGDNYLGIKQIDSTSAPGLYELHLPDNILATGTAQVVIFLRGETNMVPIPIEIQLGSSTLDEEVDNDGTSISLKGAQKLMLSVLTGVSSGGGSGTLTFKKLIDGTTTRISVTADANGNRTAVGTRDAT